MTAYEKVGNVIEQWCERNEYYTDFLVTLSVGGKITTEYLESNANELLWLKDWWEGEEDVTLLGFAPVDSVVLHGAPGQTKGLKPCPFCGGKAVLEQMGWPHHVYCTFCGAKTTSTLTGEDGENEAAAKWNRRPTDGLH